MATIARTTLDYLRARGITRSRWVAEYGHDGVWTGDRCGCPDDRCFGYHHDEHESCQCVRFLADDIDPRVCYIEPCPLG